MKKLIVILFITLSLFASSNVLEIHNQSRINDSLLNHVIKAAVDSFKLDTLYLIVCTMKYTSMSSNNDCYGLTQRTSRHNFNICIDDFQLFKDVVKSIFHEMVHVDQYEHGTLYLCSANKVAVFKGYLYTSATLYENRPFEIEADAKAQEYYKCLIKQKSFILHLKKLKA